MEINNEIKENIINEFEQWKQKTYGGLTDKQRRELGAFHTPPLLTIKMVEKFDSLNGIILDPMAGSGNLIAGCILAGANPLLCYANELDPSIYNVLVERLTSLGVPRENIMMMDALSPEFETYMRELSEWDKSFKVIANPPFSFCGRKKKSLKDLFDIADDYVVLATWLFCNNVLEQQELIMPEEWREVYQIMGLSVKHLSRNKEEKPKFYLEKTCEYKDGFCTNMNTHYLDLKSPQYKNLKLEDFTEDSLIRKVGCASSGHYFAKGTKRDVWIIPKKDYSEYKEQIFIDTLKWSSLMNRFPHIRQEFIDD